MFFFFQKKVNVVSIPLVSDEKFWPSFIISQHKQMYNINKYTRHILIQYFNAGKYLNEKKKTMQSNKVARSVNVAIGFDRLSSFIQAAGRYMHT